MYAISSIRSTDHPSLFIDIYNLKLLFYSDNIEECVRFLSKLINVKSTNLDSILNNIQNNGYDNIYSPEYLYFFVDLNFKNIEDNLIKMAYSKIKDIIREKSINDIIKKGDRGLLFD
jgi:hypothetical protein